MLLNKVNWWDGSLDFRCKEWTHRCVCVCMCVVLVCMDKMRWAKAQLIFDWNIDAENVFTLMFNDNINRQAKQQSTQIIPKTNLPHSLFLSLSEKKMWKWSMFWNSSSFLCVFRVKTHHTVHRTPNPTKRDRYYNETGGERVKMRTSEKLYSELNSHRKNLCRQNIYHL